MLMPSLQSVVKHASGLHLSEQTVAREARSRMHALGLTGLGAYLEHIRSDPEEMTALIERLVVPETWLFRDPEAFVAAGDFARARHAATGRGVRLLSLPCASGEEPYSLSMALLDAGMSPAHFTIDAVDISAAALARAETATYGHNAFRGRHAGFRSRFFTPGEHGERLDPAVRAQVRFSQGNLLSMQPAPGGRPYDVIFCRNLLIYFDEPTQRRAIAILGTMLDEDGLLFTGYAELPVFATQGFSTAQLPGAFALRKKAAIPTPPRRPRPAGIRPTGMRTLLRPVTAAGTKAHSGTEETSTAVLLDQAGMLADRGQLDTAAERLGEYLAKAPASARAQAMLGAVHAGRGDDAAAEQCLRRALYLDPTLYEVMCQLAILAEKQGNPAAANAMRLRAARAQARASAKDAAPVPARPQREPR